MNRLHGFGLLVALALFLVPGGCGSRTSTSGLAYTPALAADAFQSLDAVEAHLVRLLDAMEAASERAPESADLERDSSPTWRAAGRRPAAGTVFSGWHPLSLGSADGDRGA